MDIEIKHKHPLLKKYGSGALIALAVAGIVAWGLSSSGESTYHTDSAGVLIEETVKGAFNDFVRITGRVETGTIVHVSALETGIVDRKWVEEGAMVNAGDIIITLHNPNLQQQILDSESQLAERQNMLRDTEISMERERLQIKQDLLAARTDYNRKERVARQQRALYDEDLTSREEYLKADEDLQLARENLDLLTTRLHSDSAYRSVQVEMMQESLQNMRENFAMVRRRADNLNIRASHTGQLGSLTAELGQNISAGQQVGQINILDNYKLVVSIDEHYIDRVVTGLKARATRGGSDLSLTVRKVYPEVANGQFKADLTLDSIAPANIRVGQSFSIDLQLGDPSEAVMIPRGSFFQSTGGRWVYVVDSDGHTARKRNVRIGRQNPRYYEVLEGLEPGERVITSSYTAYGDADRVVISK